MLVGTAVDNDVVAARLEAHIELALSAGLDGSRLTVDLECVPIPAVTGLVVHFYRVGIAVRLRILANADLLVVRSTSLDTGEIP